MIAQSISMMHEETLRRIDLGGVLKDCQIWWLPAGAPTSEPRAIHCTLSGRMVVAGHTVHLQVSLPTEFPRCLPEIEVLEMFPPVGELPHLSAQGQGKVCFPQDANLLDADEPYAIVLDALAFTRNLLERMLPDSKRASEFAREAFVYWGQMAQRGVECVVTLGEHPAPIWVLSKGDELRAVVDDVAEYVASRAPGGMEGLESKFALYLPLGAERVASGFHPRELATLDGLRKHVRALPEEDRIRLSLLLGHVQGTELFVVVGLRRPQEERALLGLRIFDIQGGHPLEDVQALARIEPVLLRRRDHSFLAPRGGAGKGLRSRRVLLAGCGAVGGYIAFSLARAGIGGISLVDPDLLALENTYRHVCGLSWAGISKVVGLQWEIERAIPYVSVNAYRGRFERLLDSNASLLLENDLVISAMGHPTMDLDLNKRVWSDTKHPPVIFTWLEPLGVGGHALLTHRSKPDGFPRGCLKCLYSRPVEGGAIQNRAAFASPDAVYTRDTLGCGSRYLPFADLDAQRTAELATRLALRALRGEVSDAPLLSWRGERKPFEDEGFSVTELFSKALDPFGYIREDCPICSGK
ncbi:ThiF family adenylyltransferase [Corallococcus terminator]|uniref:THIF-type NAD/FAD binding fold domain-containing protein n=1 Tax=Corallococcus terminator TaxID=2316733 RepID=A0A3A8JFM6_9BACT|nr:ThiF family adenylyltransferase [Corallococcus terminator]RKG89311.1 hypothetical protein D7V88_12865 [Corallococcus terminator]